MQGRGTLWVNGTSRNSSLNQVIGYLNIYMKISFPDDVSMIAE